MGSVHELGAHRDWFDDVRGDGRRLQVTWHPEHGFVVVSLWHRDTCTSTFQLPIGEAPRVITLLANALGEEAAAGRITTGSAADVG